MSFKDLQLRGRYTTLKQNVVEEFYSPVLRNSVVYCRVSCYFSSSSLASVAEAITQFVNKGRTMYLIIGSSLAPSEVEAMKKGTEDFEELMHKKWLDCLEITSTNMLIKNRFEALAWLLAHDILKIKIGVNIDESGDPISPEDSKFHEKIMIFEDEEGNIIHTDGSNNESRSAEYSNRESFSVHKSWMPGTQDIIDDAKEEFWDLWNNTDKDSRTYDIPNAIKESIIKMAPEQMPPHDHLYSPHISIEKRTLRKYQKSAIQAWMDNGHRGILQMATGSGKTFTAMNILKNVSKIGLCVVIVVPQKELSEQWIDECSGFFGQDVPLLDCRSDSGWKTMIDRFIRQTTYRFSIIISITKTFMMDTFQKAVRPVGDRLMVVADEVHEMGAEGISSVLETMSYPGMRLGLSATPMHVWDDSRNRFVTDYFGEVVFKWTLHDAIYPPTGEDPCLVPYRYHVNYCTLNAKELEQYSKLSEEISKLVPIRNSDVATFFKSLKKNSKLSTLLIRRASIIQSCASRKELLKTIVQKNEPVLKKCIVYCENIEEINNFAKMLTELGYDSLKYHSNLDPDQRKAALEDFKNGSSRFIVAVGCLDQGVDIPNCDSAIILSSSKNPREYVQRRGRVLRLNGPSKPLANIFDTFVLPYDIEDVLSGREALDGMELRIIKGQMDRIDEFIKESLNGIDVEKEISLLRAVCGGA